jgi:hypothetical protein
MTHKRRRFKVFVRVEYMNTLFVGCGWTGGLQKKTLLPFILYAVYAFVRRTRAMPSLCGIFMAVRFSNGSLRW